MTYSITKKAFGFALASALFLSGAMYAQAATEIVYPGNPDWLYGPETGDGVGSYENGPDTPPLGSGSFNFLNDDGTDGTAIGKSAYAGLAFAEIDTLTYSTYVDPGSASTVQAPSLQFNGDADVTDGDMSWQGRLVFEPYFTEVVTKGVWQTWDTMTQGKWWSTGAPVNATCSQGTPCTWAELISAFPNVGVNAGGLEAIIVKAGSGWPAFDGNVDAITIVSAANLIDDTYDFELDYPVSGEIISPTEDEVVEGLVDLVATYDDGDDADDDTLNWAVRPYSASCNTGSNLFGGGPNVSDVVNSVESESWDGADFAAVIDSTLVADGAYCLAFNPTDDGPVDVRVVRHFIIDNDSDDDGVPNELDKCEGPADEDEFEMFGDSTNRWMWDGDSWETIESKGKGKGPKFEPTLDYTHGCTGEQILDAMSAIEEIDEDFEGHYKYGLSKGLLEAWHEGVYHVGWAEIDSLLVSPYNASAAYPAPVVTNVELQAGNDYKFVASGVWTRGTNSFDAQYSAKPDTWGENGDVDNGDLRVNDDTDQTNWGPLDAVTHTYEMLYTPGGNEYTQFYIWMNDVTKYPSNNDEPLTVDISQDVWVDLW